MATVRSSPGWTGTRPVTGKVADPTRTLAAGLATRFLTQSEVSRPPLIRYSESPTAVNQISISCGRPGPAARRRQVAEGLDVEGRGVHPVIVAAGSGLPAEEGQELVLLTGVLGDLDLGAEGAGPAHGLGREALRPAPACGPRPRRRCPCPARSPWPGPTRGRSGRRTGTGRPRPRRCWVPIIPSKVSPASSGSSRSRRMRPVAARTAPSGSSSTDGSSSISRPTKPRNMPCVSTT